MARASGQRDQRHARIYAHWLAMPAWRTLTGDAMRLLVHMLALHRPGENGLHDFSVRQASAAIGRSKSQAARALLELEEKGWVHVVRIGRFQARNKASRYALAMYPNDATGELATSAFRGWPE